jgi:hypothetical protein
MVCLARELSLQPLSRRLCPPPPDLCLSRTLNSRAARLKRPASLLSRSGSSVPILNTQLAGEAFTSDGKSIPLPPHMALLQRGPVAQVSVSVGQVIAQQVLQQGGNPSASCRSPCARRHRATTTCIDEEAARALELPAIDVVNVASASQASSEQNVYPISIKVVGLPIVVNAPRAIGAALKSQGLLVLIGRDVLHPCLLIGHKEPSPNILFSHACETDRMGCRRCSANDVVCRCEVYRNPNLYRRH